MTINPQMFMRKRGMSLIELLVYISILTFLTILIMNTLASTTRLSTTANQSGALTRSAITALDRLNKAVKSADSASIVGGGLVLNGTAFDLSQFAETGVTLANVAYTLTNATSSVKVHARFDLNGTTFYSTSVLRHKP